MSCKFVRALLIASLAIGMLDLAGVAARADAAAQKDPWPELARDIFGERPLADGTDVLAIEMPSRAEDAAIVPLTVRATLPPTETRRVRSFTIVIDENPAPLAATFHIGSGAIVSAISTRVRVNTYSHVHAVAELSDGKLYVVGTYVKASGGCSAPASKDAVRSGIGEMRFRQFSAAADLAASNMREAQIMLRHPNNSGLQMDQVTRLYVPAFFVQSLRIWQGEEFVLAMEGSISISEDPNFRFTYRPNDAKTVRAEAIDTKDHVFKGGWSAGASRVENPESAD